MEKLILVARFIDRSGRTVYDVHQDDPKKRVCSPGEFIGQLRMNVTDSHCAPTLELVKEMVSPPQKPVDGGGTG